MKFSLLSKIGDSYFIATQVVSLFIMDHHLLHLQLLLCKLISALASPVQIPKLYRYNKDSKFIRVLAHGQNFTVSLNKLVLIYSYLFNQLFDNLFFNHTMKLFFFLPIFFFFWFKFTLSENSLKIKTMVSLKMNQILHRKKPVVPLLSAVIVMDCHLPDASCEIGKKLTQDRKKVQFLQLPAVTLNGNREQHSTISPKCNILPGNPRT